MKTSVELPRRAESARNALITYIHDNGLTTGDRLPAYAHLRSEFGFGSRTISAAVDSLCKLGVLEVRDKVGIFVADPHGGGQMTGRTVAVIVRPLARSAYAATLASFIQKLLADRSCRCLTFYQSSESSAILTPDLTDFPGLEQAVSEHRCDGIISLCPLTSSSMQQLKKHGVPCCFIGDDDQDAMPLSVVIEVKRFISDAEEALRKNGCRNIVQLCTSSEQLASRGAKLPSLIGNSYDGGVDISEKLLALPASDRPDGIISDDDTVVSGLLAGIISRQLPNISYLPHIATIIHTELGEKYPSDRMILFRQHIEKYAYMAVELLLDTLRGDSPETKQLFYRFEPVQ